MIIPPDKLFSKRQYQNSVIRLAPTEDRRKTPTSPTSDQEQFRIGTDILGLSGEHDPFVSAVRATRMPMIITNPRLADNPVVFANDAFCRLTGYPRDEILGRNCRFLQGPDTDSTTVARIRAAVQATVPIEIDIRNHRKDGTTFWNRLLLAPVRDAKGTLVYFFASQVDVTMEREKLANLESSNAALMAELNDRLQSQEESEARLVFATEAGRLGIWDYRFDTNELTTSRRCRQIFGAAPDGTLTLNDLRAVIHQDDADRVIASIIKSIRIARDFAIEFRILKPCGNTGWIEVRGEVQAPHHQSASRLVGIAQDISERKKHEERTRALADLDRKFAAMETTDDIAYTAAETLGQTLEVSRAGYGTVDVARETITIERDWNAEGVKTLAGVLNFRDYGSYIEDLKKGETVVFDDAEKDPRTIASAPLLTAISARAVVNMPILEIDGFVAIFYLNSASPREWLPEDLVFIKEIAQRTRMAVERRRAEDDIRSFAARLETEVAVRTGQVMEIEATLRQSQKMEAVGQLTGGLAHDFNNMLAAIGGSLELIKLRIGQNRVQDIDKFILAAEGAVRRATALTHRLLAFSRRQTLSPKSTDINHLVAGMEDLIQRTVGPAIRVSVVGSMGLWHTLVDQSQLENALLNLCINARDAMPEGGQLTIETSNKWIDKQEAGKRDLKEGQYVALAVSDTGTGMPADIVAKAFDPFFTTKPIGQGTGLGLSMIFGFMQQSGGQTRIYSEVGSGTTVQIYLPRFRGITELDADARPPEAPRAADGLTILVVDDDAAVRMLSGEILRDLGYGVLEAEDGKAALKILNSNAAIALLLTDVGLPGLNGRQIADAARNLRPALKVLFMTGYAENAVIDHGHLETGMEILTKPFSLDVLGMRVKELLEL